MQAFFGSTKRKGRIGQGLSGSEISKTWGNDLAKLKKSEQSV